MPSIVRRNMAAGARITRTNREIGIAYRIAYGLITDARGTVAFWQIFQDGGGGRTRTYEAMRRLIYSQLPLPLGTLPRSMAAQSEKPA